MNQLISDQSSHLHASMQGWSRPMSWTDLMLQLVTERVLAATRDTKKQPQPTSFGFPWDKKTHEPEVTPEERREAEKQLRQRSAFKHLRG